MATETNKTEYILYAVGDSHLMLRSCYPDPRSFKDNLAPRIWAEAERQCTLLVEHYSSHVLGNSSLPATEIGRAEDADSIFGDDLYSHEVIERLTIHAMQHVDNFYIFGSGTDSETFRSLVLAEEQFHVISSSTPVHSYEAFLLPSELFPHVFDINQLFRGFTRWDYDKSEWVTA